MSASLRSLKTNERPWANRSGCSRQMSNRERIAQVAHDKWVIVSDSLRSLMINEQFAQKNLVKNIKSYFLVCFIYVFYFKNEWFAHSNFLVSDVSESLRSIINNEWCERIPQVAYQKWATMSNSLRLLTKNERMSEVLVFLSKSLICSFFCKKTSDSLRKPMSKFPALLLVWFINL